MPATVSIPLFQSLLFVPGSRSDRFAKAVASGADIVCIDLEDAVPSEQKEAAREATFASLAPSGRIAVRINHPASAEGEKDLRSLAESPSPPAIVLIPKTEGRDEVALVSSALSNKDIGLVPLIESARGLRLGHEIAAAPDVAAMMFGGGDLSAELGVALAWDPLVTARQLFLLACAEAGKPAIDVPYVALGDDEGLAEETRSAKAFGFAAKAAIHPDQIPVIHRVMRPTPEEMEEAEEAERAFAAANGAAVRFRGRILEEPIMRRYRQTLSLKEFIHA